MKTTILIFAATAAMTGSLLYGQNVVFQQAGAIAVTGGQVGAGFGIVTGGPLGVRSVQGSPFSGTEQRHSLQVLGDGTRIERTETSLISRDSEGRLRMETMPADGEGRASITIQDPVAGANYFLDPVQKTATKLPAPKGLPMTIPPPPSGLAILSASSSIADGPRVVAMTAMPGKAGGDPPAEESLGAQTINGVLAKGTRTTIDIPVGQIGNDRALQVVSERWYSDDLQMVVKTMNSDPRFGTTTYELTNINRSEPDPTLFQIPADYTVREANTTTTIQTK